MKVSFIVQLTRFISCLVVGFCTGFIYDICSIITVFAKGKYVVFITDLIFSLLSCGAIYLYIVLSGGAQVRLYIILGGLLGLVLHYKAITMIVKKSTPLIRKLIKGTRGATKGYDVRGKAIGQRLRGTVKFKSNKLVSSKIFVRHSKNNYYK